MKYACLRIRAINIIMCHISNVTLEHTLSMFSRILTNNIWTEQNRRDQDRTEQNRTEQNRTEQNRTEQNRTEQNRTFFEL